MLKKNIIDIIATIIALVALFVAYKSWDISQKSLRLNTESYEFQNRPWLLVNIKKNKNTNRYYDIVKDGDSIYWTIQVEIENKGLSPAKNIKMPSMANLKDIYGTDKTTPIDLDRIVLGQGEKYYYDLSMGGKFKGNIDELLERYRKNDKGLQISFLVHYEGLINQESRYETKANYLIKSNSVSVLPGAKFK